MRQANLDLSLFVLTILNEHATFHIPKTSYVRFDILFVFDNSYFSEILETVLILFFRNILMYFLLRQGKIDANSLSYLRKFCSSMSEKDAKWNKWINSKQSLKIA